MKSVGQNFHRISRMNQRQSCLSDYSRICADIWPLANGSRPICAAIVFGHADFTDDADFSSWEGFVPQISQIYTDFLWNLRRIALSNLRGYLQRPNRSHRRKSVSNRLCRKPPNNFRVIRWKEICVICEICGTRNNITEPQSSYFVWPASSNVWS